MYRSPEQICIRHYHISLSILNFFLFLKKAKRPASKRTIDCFFSKIQKVDPQSSSDASSSSKESTPSASTSIVARRVENVPSPSLSADTADINEPPFQPRFASDIGSYVGQNNIDDFTKAKLLEHHWKPPPDYTFPHNVVMKKGTETKKYARRSHLDKFPWLVLSHKDQGLYCVYCDDSIHDISEKIFVQSINSSKT